MSFIHFYFIFSHFASMFYALAKCQNKHHSQLSLLSCLFTWDNQTYDYTVRDREPSINTSNCSKIIFSFYNITTKSHTSLNRITKFSKYFINRNGLLMNYILPYLSDHLPLSLHKTFMPLPKEAGSSFLEPHGLCFYSLKGVSLIWIQHYLVRVVELTEREWMPQQRVPYIQTVSGLFTSHPLLSPRSSLPHPEPNPQDPCTNSNSKFTPDLSSLNSNQTDPFCAIKNAGGGVPKRTSQLF